MLLPRGITGFRMADDPPLPRFEAQIFTAIGFAVARELGVSVLSRDAQPNPGRNFMVITLQSEHGTWNLLGHTIYPILASVAGPIEIREQNFIDLPGLATVAHLFESTIYPASLLNQPVKPDWLVNLAVVELKQIRYWKPQRLGELIFNHWD